ncbi:MAG: hypothetical protein CM15mP47_2070 [Methanobacteriota archaeon]|nr:MAG: hypothetical protein CM15mP47_2070 [Euryarchaeota archaeon]
MFDENTLDSIDSFDEDDIDIFAELGVTGVRPTNNLAEQKQQQNENLAILLGNNEEDENTADNESIPQMNITPAAEEPYGSLPDETISELLEILVKQELTVSEGKEIIDSIPAKAKLNLESAKVKKVNDEYEISVIIDVDGSGPVRPFAKIKSENNILNLHETPNSIPSGWIPLHNILRDILTKAMQMLSSTNFTINNNV